jgi:hypothetical protein
MSGVAPGRCDGRWRAAPTVSRPGGPRSRRMSHGAGKSEDGEGSIQGHPHEVGASRAASRGHRRGHSNLSLSPCKTRRPVTRVAAPAVQVPRVARPDHRRRNVGTAAEQPHSLANVRRSHTLRALSVDVAWLRCAQRVRDETGACWMAVSRSVQLHVAHEVGVGSLQPPSTTTAIAPARGYPAPSD